MILILTFVVALVQFGFTSDKCGGCPQGQSCINTAKAGEVPKYECVPSNKKFLKRTAKQSQLGGPR